jgi:hypothetical protein
MNEPAEAISINVTVIENLCRNPQQNICTSKTII